MGNREVALEFVRCFCAGDADALAPLLAEDLQLKGPLYRFDSAEAYLLSLKNDPPERCGYRLISVTEEDDYVSIYYDYQRRDGALTIAQLFRFRKQKISEVLLVFDSKGLA